MGKHLHFMQVQLNQKKDFAGYGFRFFQSSSSGQG